MLTVIVRTNLISLLHNDPQHSNSSTSRIIKVFLHLTNSSNVVNSSDNTVLKMISFTLKNAKCVPRLARTRNFGKHDQIG